MMAGAHEREQRQPWKEKQAVKECTVATAADVVCEPLHNVAFDSQFT